MKFDLKEINFGDQEYPELLSKISDPPERLFLVGEIPKNPCVSIVGTRKSSSEGKQIAKKIATSLSSRGFCIVSGLALGIDASAHEGAISFKSGKTLAVLANGLDSIYPRRHEQLAMEILNCGGGIISEYPTGTPPLPHQFLARNRIVSGLSIATIVIEAPRRSGSIATARLAAEQGREVFVFPGNAHNPNYAGSHLLIRNGARLVSSVEDIFEDLGIESKPLLSKEPDCSLSENGLFSGHNDETIKIIKTLEIQPSSVDVDKLSELTKLEPRTISELLSILVIEGAVYENNGKFGIIK